MTSSRAPGIALAIRSEWARKPRSCSPTITKLGTSNDDNCGSRSGPVRNAVVIARHMAGDDVLASVASLLQRAVRSVDIVARYGGEEFIIVLPETGRQGAMPFADRIRGAKSTAADLLGQLGRTREAGVIREQLKDDDNPVSETSKESR